MLTLPLANAQLWLTPIWLLAVGVTAGMLVVAAVWGIIALINRSLSERLFKQLLDGVLLPISYVTLTFVVIALLLTPTMPWRDAWDSISRIGVTNPDGATISATIPPQTDDQELSISFRADELLNYSLKSDQDLRISTSLGNNIEQPEFLIEGGPEAYVYGPKSKKRRVFMGEINSLYITNISDAPAELTFNYATDVAMPQVHNLPQIAVSVIAIYGIYLLLLNLLPGIGNIAVATSKEAIGQPLFRVLMALGVFACIAFIYIPYNTFGEDVKMLKDSGLTTIMIFAILFALWTASTSIAEEIEGKTALTLLSKPISRRQFILGKFAGIVSPLVLMFVVLGAVLLVVVSYKVVYDARETSNPTPDWQLCYDTMIGTVPGLVLGFFEALVFAAISVAISTRLSMVPNLIICFSIYVVGNLLPQLVNAAEAQDLPFIGFTGNFIASILPMLHVFNIAPAIAGGKEVPLVYLGWSALYAAIYSTAAMLLALALFEDRDLA